MAIFALFGRHRLVLSPEEEFALIANMHGAPKAEMRAELFDVPEPK